MTLPSASSDRTLNIYLSLAQYPILSTQIRARMRREIFRRGVITPQAFEIGGAREGHPLAGPRGPCTTPSPKSRPMSGSCA